MKRKLFNKRDIAIDLTSLLDVIFIILMVVMCNQHVNTSGAEGAEQTLHPVVPESVESMVATVEVNVSVDYKDGISDKKDIERWIDLVINESDVPKVIKITADDGTVNTEAALEQLKSELGSFISANGAENTPVILTMGDGEMLYRDAVKVSDLLMELDREYDNLYCRGLLDE